MPLPSPSLLRSTLFPILLEMEMPIRVSSDRVGSINAVIVRNVFLSPRSTTLWNSWVFFRVFMRRAQALNLFLPFCLLLFIIALPDLVLILFLNPWFFFLFLVFG